MKRYANLMTTSAVFRTAMRLHVRRWSLALGVLAVALAPIAAIRWEEARQARQEREAKEASYEPMRRLVQLNRDLRAEAGKLVKDERLELELSCRRHVSSLLTVVVAAAEESQGQLFVQHLQIHPNLPQGAAPLNAAASAEQKMVIEAAATLTYDVARLVEGLRKDPIKSVKVTSDVVVSQDGKDHKKYTVECLF
jgi:hypothetical protein